MIILRLRRADAPTAVRMPRSPLRKIASGIIGVLDTDIPPAPIATPLESHRALLRYVERRVGDRALAQDILQDAFAKVSPDLSRHPTMKPSCRTEGSILRQFGRARLCEANLESVSPNRLARAEHGGINCTCRQHAV